MPPVAIKSSIISIFSPFSIESLCTSIVASPYSSLKSIECLSAGSLFFFLNNINGFSRMYETAAANTKPLDSIAEILSNFNFLEISIILSIEYLKANGSLISVVISLNKIPFFV